MLTRNARILLPTFALLVSAMSASAQDDWQHHVEIYAMGTSINGDASIGRAADVELEVDFSTILENLELGGMARYEALHKSDWGVIVDYSFMDLGADIASDRGGIVDAGLRQGVLEALGFKRQRHSYVTVDYTFGVRWWDNDVDLSLDPAIWPQPLGVAVEEDWIDLVVGVRAFTPINESWQFTAQGDIGGFGLESDFTGLVQMGVIYSMSERWKLNLKYKAVWVDYRSGDKGEVGSYHYDTVTHGPVVGVAYQF